MWKRGVGRGFFPFLLLVFLFLFAGCEDDDCDCAASGEEADDDSGDSDDDGDDGDDDDAMVVLPVVNDPPPWPEWVLTPWVWEDESTQESALALVDGYIEHDIPVGAIIIDSPWETGYNTFEFDPIDYPEPQAMIDEFHEKGVRVFLWITPNVNEDSPNFQEGFDAGYFLNNGRTLEWWKGRGAFIDYFNPEALDWWHGQMDKALDLGIDGWKTDGSEFALYGWLYLDTAQGPKLVHEYQRAYYRDFFEYTRMRLGPDRVISARPVDSYGFFWGPSFTDVDVNFAGWVGDQDPTFEGLVAALLNMFMSGTRGYVNFGSDIGGYRGDGMRDRELFVRWAQLGAMSPIMENGGAGEHRPWIYDDEVLEIYRDFARLHTALIPYLYSQGAESFAAGISLFRPVHRRTWEYKLGRDIFVAAMTEPGDTRQVHFPEEGVWIDFWNGAKYEAGSTATISVPLERYPIFVRQGAIIPMGLRAGSVFSQSESSGNPVPLTVSLYPDSGDHAFHFFEEGGAGAKISYTLGDTLDIRLSATARDCAFRIHDADAPSSVVVEPHGVLDEADSLESLRAAQDGYSYDPLSRQLWIKSGAAARGIIIVVQ